MMGYAKLYSSKAFAITMLGVVITTAACGTFFTRKPWREYSALPFNEQAWKAGDTLERGRMRHDMMDKIEGKTRAETLRLLGEPDETTTEKGIEYIWYYTEHPGRRSLLKTPINFGSNDRAKFGI